jgi:hypothetical protein
MSDTVGVGALRPADVLLYHGTGWLARLIRFFDGTDFNHAGLCLGDGSVAEAQAPGVIRQGVEPSVAGRVKVLVRRLKQDVSLDPVVARGLQIVDEGHRYAFEQLLLLAFLGLTRKLKATPILRTLLRKALDRAASVASGIIGAGKEPMICSEFVYRCYDEALPEAADVYALEVNPFPRAIAPPARRAVAPAPLRGRGVHPDSLLAWRLAAGPVAPGPRAPRAAAPPVPPTDEELAELAELYLAEARGEPVRARAPRVADADLAASIDNFALSLQPRRRARLSEPLAREVAVRDLLATVPDFVTPGDLLNTESLFSVGELELPPAPKARARSRRSPLRPRKRQRG